MDEATIRSLIEQVVRELSAETAANGAPLAPPPPPASGKMPPTTVSVPPPTGRIATSTKVNITETGPAEVSIDPKEVVVALSPAFSSHLFETITNIPHAQVLKEICAGIEEEGMKYRFVKVYRTADVGFVAHEAAKLSGSGIGIGIQSRGTTVIHQKDLPPLSNLELFSQAPLIDPETFRAIGKNAGRYAKGESPSPVPVRNDQMARPKYQAIAALLHNKETRLCDLKKKTQLLQVSYS